MKTTQYLKYRFLYFTILTTCTLPAISQTFPFDSLLRANSFEIFLKDGKYSGPGLKFLSDAAMESQFFCLCEEHNMLELNELSSYLFEDFHKQYGYNYLVLEQGCAISSFYGLPENRGNFEAIASLARHYPQSPTFATDEELKLIADAGRISTSTVNPIWGVDQDLGALHILERLSELAPDLTAKKNVDELAELARHYEIDRINGDTLFMTMVATPELFDELPALFHPIAGSEAAFLIDALQRSTRIYYNNYLGRKGQLKLFESASEREHSMKLRFMENYNIAQKAGDPLPKVFAKMGHFHLLRGIFNLKVTTFGNLLSELAISNGSENFVLASFAIHSPDKWRNSSSLLESVASDAMFTVIDFRPLRALAFQKKISDMPEGWEEFLYRSDAGLIVNEGRTGSYDIIKSAIAQ